VFILYAGSPRVAQYLLSYYKAWVAQSELVKEYDTNGTSGTIGTLSVAGMVPAIDVYYAFFMCHSYKMAIVKGLFRRQSDYEEVTGFPKELILAEIEVVPVNFLIRRSHRSMYVYVIECIVFFLVVIGPFSVMLMPDPLGSYSSGLKCVRPNLPSCEEGLGVS